MATSVKTAEDTTSRLAELQAVIKLETGTKVTGQELGDLSVEYVFKSPEDLVDSVRDDDE